MENYNPFELLMIPTSSPDREVIAHCRFYNGIEPVKKQKAMQDIVVHAGKRLVFELGTFHDADYNLVCNESDADSYREFLRLQFDANGFASIVSPQMTAYLLKQHNEVAAKLSSKQKTEHSAILQELEADIWVKHTFALLHERCARDQENHNEQDQDTAMEHWKKSIHYWKPLLSDSQFYKLTHAFKINEGNTKAGTCTESWKNFSPEFLTKYHDDFTIFLVQNKPELAGNRYICVMELSQISSLTNMAGTHLSDMDNEIKMKCDAIFDQDMEKVPQGFRGHYLRVFDFLERFPSEIQEREDIILYTLDKYSNYFLDIADTGKLELANQSILQAAVSLERAWEKIDNTYQSYLIVEKIDLVVGRLESCFRHYLDRDNLPDGFSSQDEENLKKNYKAADELLDTLPDDIRVEKSEKKPDGFSPEELKNVWYADKVRKILGEGNNNCPTKDKQQAVMILCRLPKDYQVYKNATAEELIKILNGKVDPPPDPDPSLLFFIILHVKIITKLKNLPRGQIVHKGGSVGQWIEYLDPQSYKFSEEHLAELKELDGALDVIDPPNGHDRTKTRFTGLVRSALIFACFAVCIVLCLFISVTCTWPIWLICFFALFNTILPSAVKRINSSFPSNNE